ncbi:hypothetical protein PAHAL_7G170700 [Panicum hallii]|uniref:Uncharacterized protein n=1 Tax=Panicum hallii TaxID=206008 RepID=A0A2T8ICJ5_9POAL|nr:hypothetical protein PAHAL_7G170700 [Panicum hallii]
MMMQSQSFMQLVRALSRSRQRTDVIMKGVAVSGMSGAPILSRKGVSTMLTGGAPGFTVSITTEGIKAVLEMFLTDRELIYTPDASHHALEMSS